MIYSILIYAALSITSQKIDFEGDLKNLMAPYQTKLEAKEKKLKETQLKKVTYEELDRKIDLLTDNTRKFISFDSPFLQMKGISEDESMASLEALAGSVKAEYKLEISQVAAVDKFRSKTLDLEYRIPEARYEFMVGTKAITLNFKGGDLDRFSRALNAVEPKFLTSQVFKQSKGKQILVLESLKTGSEQKITFSNATLDWSKELEFVRIQEALDKTYDLEKEVNIAKEVKPYTLLKEKNILLNTRGEAHIKFPEPMVFGDYYELHVKLEVLDTSPKSLGNKDDAFPLRGRVTLEETTVLNSKSLAFLEEIPESLPVVDPMILYLDKEGEQVPLDAIDFKEGTQDLVFNLKDFTTFADAIGMKNLNTYKNILIKEVRIVNTQPEKILEPVFPISIAQDAHFKVDGVDFIRDKNEITDVIATAKLHLKKKTKEDPIALNIDFNRELITNSVIEFVKAYNDVIIDINVYTAYLTNEEKDLGYAQIIEEMGFPEDIKKKYYERLGLLRSEYFLNNVKDELKMTLAGFFQGTQENPLKLFSDIGISTDANREGTGFSKRDEWGVLDINFTKFDEAIKNQTENVAELFSFDSNDDLVPDRGLSVKVRDISNKYVGRGGFITTSLVVVNADIKSQNQDISKYKQEMTTQEKKISADLRKIDSALQQQEQASKTFDSLYGTGNNNKK